jgi:predicted nuclease of restriction endonuclease-like (RecB) superfamily
MMENEISKSQKHDQQYQELVSDIGGLLANARQHIASSVNTILVETYWQIGRYIVEYEQKGAERAEYGSNLLNRLSNDLTLKYGKGFGKSNLLYMRKLYITFPKSGTLSHLLSWSHYYEILKSDDALEISFYTKECEKQNWSVRELKRQMKSMLFHRMALSKDKEGVLALASQGIEVQKAEDIIKDPYVLEFVGLPDRDIYKEDDLENALIENLSKFMLELGKGFAYIGRQYRFSIAGRHYRVDLVFYNVILKCYCLIDLKRGDVQHEDVGQMNFYLNYFKKEVCTEGDNEPIGIILGANADKLTMEYAMNNISNQLFVSRYQLYLPDRDLLEAQLKRLLENEQCTIDNEQ